jgi:hypothetical protein
MITAAHYSKIYSVMDKVQIAAFSVQEFIISGLYAYEARRIICSGRIFQRQRTRQVLWRVIGINGLIILLGISLLVASYVNMNEILPTYKACVYSVKLRLEYSILNQLMAAVRDESAGSHMMSVNMRDMALSVFNRRGSSDEPKNTLDIIPTTSYTAFATKAKRASDIPVIEKDRIAMTTKVIVHGSHVSLPTGNCGTVGSLVPEPSEAHDPSWLKRSLTSSKTGIVNAHD